jgi:spore germination protein GerM
MKRLLAAVALIAAASASACGVPVEPGPRPVDLPGRSATVPADPAPGEETVPAGPVAETLYLIKESRVVAVKRYVPTLPSPEAQLAELLTGPSQQEQDQGLSSALAGTDLTLGVRIISGQAVVELAASLDGTGRTDDILAFAQIVCTLTSRPDITSVTFTRAGQQVEVPRADSSLSRAPLTAADYATLLAG